MTTQTENKYTATAWSKGKSEDESIRDYTTPSGQLCQIKNLKMEDILRLGLIDKLDTFTPFFADLDSDGKEKSPMSSVAELSRSGNMDAFLETLDIMLVECVLQPKIKPLPEKGKAKNKNFIYTDQIELLDKFSIFGEVFAGMSDMEPFRDGSEEGVGGLESEPSLQDSTV